MHRLLQITPGLLLAAVSLAAENPPVNPREHPSFRPPADVRPPAVSAGARTDIDRFIIKRLEEKRLALNPEADRATLVRRVAFDLTGLPPTIAEINDYVGDTSANAHEKMVDRYLASPRYGERWGKYWLDAAGYADSNGYFNADSDRPLAWRYRDYVIRSFNADKPYDRFVREQIAGDELLGFVPGGDVTPEIAESLIATHFLRNAPDGSGESDGNPDEVLTDRFTVLEGNIQNVMNSLLGVTVQCARCHDHKFEPITQREYYALQAILFPVYNPDRWTKPNERALTIGSKSERAEKKRLNELIDRQVAALKTGLAGVADSFREQLLEERLRPLDPAVRETLTTSLKTPKDKQNAAQQAALKTHQKTVTISDDDLAKRFPEFGALRDQANKTIAERQKTRPAPEEKIAVFAHADPELAVHHLLKRGQHNQPGEEVSPGVPAALSSAANSYQLAQSPKDRPVTGRRLAFAKWVTSPENPLFARTMVNRVWQHHFGNGLSATPDNLGASGAKPSHPELLDWLANEFRASGWSVKKLHRLIMNSAVYRQSSAPRAGLEAIDPDNRLLAKFPVRRLDSEAIRDAMLFVAGELNEERGGPYVPSTRNADGVVDVPENAAGHKRSVYLQQRRTQTVTFLQLFDSPTIVSTCGKRSPSTVPLQSLALLNSEFARLRGQAFARRVIKEAGENENKRLTLAFQLACGRAPTEDESRVCQQFWLIQNAARTTGAAKPDAWGELCQMLLAGNAFLYVE